MVKIVLPKPAQWSHDKLLNWLKQNLLMWRQEDMIYVKHHISVFKVTLGNSIKVKKNQFQLDQSVWARSGWDGIAPNVHLITIITSDELKNAFIHRNDAHNRQQLDARGTESARVSFFEQVRIKFNDPSYLVSSLRLSPTWGSQVFLDSLPCN